MKVSAVNLNTNNVRVQERPVMQLSTCPIGVQKPDTFERTTTQTEIKTQPVQVEVREEFANTINTLSSMHDKAREAFNNQVAADGWSGKLADKISVLWGSKNRASVVNQDLIEFDNDVQRLDNAAKAGNFKATFKETFGLDYNKEAVDNFEKVSEEYTLIQVSKEIAAKTEDNLSPYVSYFEKGAKYLSPNDFSSKAQKRYNEADKKFNEFEKNLAVLTGGEENLKKTAAAQHENFEQLSREDKVKVYSQIAEQLIDTTKETAKSIQGERKDKEIQKEYDEAYANAYGSENNIVKRVDKYIRSQQVGAVMIRDSLLAAAIGATVATSGTAYPILVGSGMTLAGNIGLDVSEYLTNDIDNKIDLSKDSVKSIVKDAAISSAEYMAGSALYEVIPMANTASSFVNGAVNTARTLGIELSTAFVAEYARTGKWATDQIDPKTFIKLVLATYAIEELTRMGLSSNPKASGQNGKIPEKVMEKFSERANEELQKRYLEAPRDVLNLKFISMQNPEKFGELLSTTLSEVVTEM